MNVVTRDGDWSKFRPCAAIIILGTALVSVMGLTPTAHAQIVTTTGDACEETSGGPQALKDAYFAILKQQFKAQGAVTVDDFGATLARRGDLCLWMMSGTAKFRNAHGQEEKQPAYMMLGCSTSRHMCSPASGQ